MRLQRSSRSWSIECRISAASFTLAKRFAATAASYVNSSVSALALVGAPYVLSHRRHLEIGDRVQGEVLAAPAILSHGRRADQSEHHHNEQQTAHSQKPVEIAPWTPGAAQTRISFAQQPLNILCLVEVLGGTEPNRRNKPRRCELGCEEIRAGNCGAGEIGASQGGASKRGVGQIRIPEGCEFEIDTREIGITQDGS